MDGALLAVIGSRTGIETACELPGRLTAFPGRPHRVAPGEPTLTLCVEALR